VKTRGYAPRAEPCPYYPPPFLIRGGDIKGIGPFLIRGGDIKGIGPFLIRGGDIKG